METIDKIYELIKKDSTINTFNNNQELFQEFYYHNMSIQYYGNKVIEIYKYLLSLNINEYHETMPYINSKIILDFNKYEQYITQSVYMKDRNIDDNYVYLLFKLIEDYNQIKQYENQSQFDKIIDNNLFTRDYTGSMIIILNSSFFKLSNDNINKMLELIKNNSYLQSIIKEGKIGKNMLDIDYIFQYSSRFLFNLEFINTENIKNDILIKAIKESKFNDKNILIKIFKNTNIDFLLEAFDNNISSLIDILEKSFNDEVYRLELFRIIYNKLLKNEEYKILFDFIIQDNRYKQYINDNEKNLVIKYFCNNYPLNITKEEIKYILNHTPDELFLINLKADYSENKWDEETRNQIREATKNIPEFTLDFNSSIKLLDSLFTNSSKVNILMLFESLKRLIKDYLNDESIRIHMILSDSMNGCAYKGKNCIQLNYKTIRNLLLSKNPNNNPKSLHILETIFHEARHIEQFEYMKKGQIDDNIYLQYKEEILSSICSNYYNKNYISISFEKDARIVGSQMVVNLLKKYFPYMKEAIKHYENKVIIETSKEEKNKSFFELSDCLTIDEALEKIISINPSIIQKYSILTREYNLDGTKKNNSKTK